MCPPSDDGGGYSPAGGRCWATEPGLAGMPSSELLGAVVDDGADPPAPPSTELVPGVVGSVESLEQLAAASASNVVASDATAHRAIVLDRPI